MKDERPRKTFYHKVFCGVLGLLTIGSFIGPLLSMGKMYKGVEEEIQIVVNLTTPSTIGK